MAVSPPIPPRTIRIKARLRSIRPRICAERAVLVTRSFQETEGEEEILRHAKALDAVLRGMTVYIAEDELIVGNQASAPNASPLFPEAAVAWLEEDLDRFETRPQDPFLIAGAVKEQLREIIPYWRGKTMGDKFLKRITPELRAALDAGLLRVKDSGGIGHHLINFPFVLREGFASIRERIVAKMAALDLTHPGVHERWVTWRAMALTCDSTIHFAARYAEEARLQALQTDDPRRRQELMRIAEICRRVPGQPAETFHEAVQVVWLLTAISHIFQHGGGVTIGRLDQFLYPYYRRDRDEGRLTDEEAQELIECLWLKLQELNVARSSESVLAWAGYEVNPTVNIGGLTKSGEDATNELTSMCLAAEAHVHMRNPQLILRVHRGTPESSWKQAVEVLKLGGGKPSFVSDAVCTKALARLGVPAEEALDYAIIGCAEPAVHDCRIMLRWGWINLPKVLELALNDGADPRSGVRAGSRTGEARGYTTFEEVFDAYRGQLRHAVSLFVEAINGVADPLVASDMPHPFFSVTIPGCVESGLDVTQGGARYYWTVLWPIGPATTGDALTAIRSLVFDERRVEMPELLEALEVDFAGKEQLRQWMLHAPKFGNDHERADAITGAVVGALYDELDRYRNLFGGPFTAGYITLGANVHYGQFVGATPDGRRCGAPLSDGMSPSQGTELKGPTAAMKSVATLDLTRAGSGGIFNQKFSPALLENPRDVAKFIDLNKTYLNDLGGLQVQHNVVSTETLRDAQRHPDRYPDLLVRVVGYSAYFTDLSREVQDDIIARTEHGG